ncbi:hypothetical protein PIB30_047985 [Stylosanthes scabra]|uniref:Uncharacterized protein n=1 Tax=Stylosanthes scabra TaxID=79078 RepID=A0ABU6TH86_9FABA|nr:hypothetical protein [Stylosanthes scabra]
MLGQAMLKRKRKNVEGHGSRSKRTRKPIDLPTHSKEDDASNAESANQFLHGSEPEREPEPTPIRVLVPKVEADLVSSPRDMLLTDTLLRMRNDKQPNKEDENDHALNEVDEQQQQQQQKQQQQKDEQPSQLIVEVVPIPTTQEVIEIYSDDEDPQSRPIKMLVPKVEQCVVSSPASILITNVLMSMAEDTAIEPQREKESQPNPSMLSFSLKLDN